MMNAMARTLGETIQDARRLAGMTQVELSKRTGIAQADLSRLENDQSNPTLTTLRRIADGLGAALVIDLVLGKETQP